MGGDDHVEAVIRVAMGDEDRVQAGHVHREGDEGAGAGVAPHPGPVLLDEIAGARPPRDRIGPGRTENGQAHVARMSRLTVPTAP